MMLWLIRIVCGLVVITGGAVTVWAAVRFLRPPAGRHQAPAPSPTPPGGAPGYPTGSMWWPEEEAWLARRDGVVHIDRNGDVDLAPWEVPHGAEAGAIMWPHQELWNGHKPRCLCPAGDHHWTACPEEEDWPDDDEPPGPLPDMLPAWPVAEGPSLVDAALASAADDPGNAGWTDQLLAHLRHAPTALDDLASCGHPRNEDGECDCSWWPERAPYLERMADTGEIRLANLRADYAAELRAQYDDTTEYISRLKSDAAQFRLTFNGL